MNIVIVDDDLALLRSLELVLQAEGHHVMSFSDPATANLYLEQQPEIDVLLLDYVMGESTGEEVLRNLSIEKSIPRKTIMITGHKEAIRSSKILQALGVDLVLCKPLDLNELCERIKTPGERNTHVASNFH